MNEPQREWVETRKLLLRVRPVAVVTPPENALRLKCFVLVSHKAFEWGIIGAILLNTCFMAVQMYPTHEWVETLDSTTNLIFSSIFALEAVLKLTALFPRQYFAQLPNCFDFFLVCTSIVDISSKARRSRAALTPLLCCSFASLTRLTMGHTCRGHTTMAALTACS
jgi:hypothetical protein